MNTNVVSALSRSAWVLIVLGIIAVLFGLMAFAWPAKTAVALAWAFGVMALAEGVISLIALFPQGRAHLPRAGWRCTRWPRSRSAAWRCSIRSPSPAS
jgi:uncharacterized membrane protein HdeD (DUF308 family)